MRAGARRWRGRHRFQVTRELTEGTGSPCCSADAIRGGGGNDQIKGRGGNDVLLGERARTRSAAGPALMWSRARAGPTRSRAGPERHRRRRIGEGQDRRQGWWPRLRRLRGRRRHGDRGQARLQSQTTASDQTFAERVSRSAHRRQVGRFGSIPSPEERRARGARPGREVAPHPDHVPGEPHRARPDPMLGQRPLPLGIELVESSAAAATAAIRSWPIGLAWRRSVDQRRGGRCRPARGR